VVRDEKTRYPGIYQRTRESGTVVYVARARVKGVGEVAKSFRRLTDAREWCRKQATALQEREAMGRLRSTLGEAVARYLAEDLPRLAISEQGNRRTQLAWWRKVGGSGLRLRDITRSWAHDEARKLRGKGLRNRPLSYATSKRYLTALSALLTSCVEWEWMARNPLHSPGRRKKAKGEREKPREREEDAEEMKKLREVCAASHDSRLLPLVVCALASGAREGELMRLRWQHVELDPSDYDFTTGTERPGVPRAKTIDPKNGDDRILYFPGEAAAVMRTLSRNRFRSCFVFADSESQSPHKEPAFPLGAWRYAKKKAKIENLRFHDLRHFWACHLLESGASIPQLMVLGGWRSVAAMRIYISRAERRGSAPVEVMHARASAPASPRMDISKEQLALTLS
jgi:integrase